jgi:hypothetical protein
MTENSPDLSPDSLSARRGRLNACLRRRNRTEFIAGGAAMAFLVVAGAIGLADSTSGSDTVAASGLILVAAGLVVMLWRLQRHAVAQRMEPSRSDQKAGFAGQLRRERDLLRSVWNWYIGPVVPGFVLVWAGMFAGGSVGVAMIGTFITVAMLAWIARANFRAAAEFDNQLRELDPVI